MARQANDGENPARVHVISVVPVNALENQRARALQIVRDVIEASMDYENLTTQLLEGTNVADTIIETSKKHDMVIMGATQEPLLRNLLTGSIPAQVAKNADVTVIIMKRRSGIIHSVLRQTVLPPTTGAGSNGTLTPPEHEVLNGSAGPVKKTAE
jgi:hypothetical protein